MPKSTHTLLAGALVGLGMVGQARAQDSSPLVLEEVIVTAQKRTESLEDIAMTVNVVTGERIAEFASFSFADISNMTAGLAISGTDFETNIATRGLGTDLNAAVASRVSLYLDGALVSQERGLFSGLYDLQQLELLRGPQGTLYGQSSPAGAITVRSRDPNLAETDGYLQQSFSSAEGSNTQFGASMPLVKDELSVRVSGLYDTNQYSDVENITLGKQDENETKAYRLVALWRPNDDFNLRLAYHDIRDNFDIDPVVRGNGISFDERKALANYASTMKNDSDYTVLELNYTFANNWTTTLVSSYQDNVITRHFDMDATQVRAQQQYVVSEIKDLVNYELRLASQAGDFWDWTIGAFYQDTSANTPVYVDTYVAPFPGFNVFAQTTGPAENESKDLGLFSHNAFQLSEKGILTLGIRYNREKRVNVQDFYIEYFRLFDDGSLAYLGSLSNQGVLPQDQRSDEDAYTGTLKYQYRFTDELMAYTSYDRGWRGGSANISGLPAPPTFGTFKPEDSDNIEVGLKWGLWGGRGLLSVAAYYQLYSDFQYQANTVEYREPGGAINLGSPVVNVDEAESYGFDSDLTLLLTENWTVNASVSYNKAEFADAGNVPCTNGQQVADEVWAFNTCDFTGERAGDLPEWSANMYTEYWREFGSTGREWYLRGLFNAESSYYSASEYRDLDSYAIIDAFLGLRSRSAGWDVNLWVKNVTDEKAELNTQRPDPIPDFENGGEVDSGYIWVKRQLAPRTAGITLGYSF